MSYSREEQNIVISILTKKNFYDIMGVKKYSSENEIKSAFRKLARKIHPDRNKCPQAHQAFQVLNGAQVRLLAKFTKVIYSQEEANIVNKILKHENNCNYHEVLGIKKFSTENEIISAFEKLAYQIHPDRNNAPDINDALQVLYRARTEMLLERRVMYRFRQFRRIFDMKFCFIL